MKQSEIYRENAENCLQLAERSKDEPAFKRYWRMAQAWIALAHEQDWLDGEVSPSLDGEMSSSRQNDREATSWHYGAP